MLERLVDIQDAIHEMKSSTSGVAIRSRSTSNNSNSGDLFAQLSPLDAITTGAQAAGTTRFRIRS